MAELLGATISGFLIILLVAFLVDRGSSKFDTALSRAIKCAMVGWIVVSLISIWGAAPNLTHMIMAGPMRLPAALIAILLLRWRYIARMRAEDDISDFE